MYTLEQKVDLIMRYIVSVNKPQQNELKKAIFEALNDEPATVEVVKTANVSDVIVDILKEVGTPPHLLGYKYLVRAAELVYEDDSYLRDITCRLYADIANGNGTTVNRVERAIRHAVEVTFDRGDFGNILSVFGNTFSANRGKLTNREFIAGFVNEVARRMRQAKGGV